MLSTKARVILALLALSLAFMASGCSKKKEKKGEAASAAPASVDGLDAIPSDADVVLAIDISALAKNRLVTRAVGQMLARDPELKKRLSALLAECQLSMGETVKGVLLGMTGERVVMVVSGQFTEAALAGCVGKTMADAGGEMTSQTTAGRTVYRVATPGDAPVFFSLGSEKSLIVSADEAWLGAALADGPKIEGRKDVAALFPKVSRDAAIWGVGLVPPAIGKGIVGMAGVKSPPAAMVTTVGLGEGFSAKLGVKMASEKEAKSAETFAKPQLKAASLVAQKKGLGQLVNRIEVTRSGEWVEFAVTVSTAEVRDILARVDRTVDTGGADEQNPASP